MSEKEKQIEVKFVEAKMHLARRVALDLSRGDYIGLLESAPPEMELLTDELMSRIELNSDDVRGMLMVGLLAGTVYQREYSLRMQCAEVQALIDKLDEPDATAAIKTLLDILGGDDDR